RRVIGAGVELAAQPTGGDGCTQAPMTSARKIRTVGAMSVPRQPLSIFGALAMTLIVVISIVTEPRPGLSGDGPWVALGVAGLLAGIYLSSPQGPVPAARRIAGAL